MTLRLLVVDDSPAIHKVIRIALSRHKFEVVPAASIPEAIIEIKRKSFALIVVDSGISSELRSFESIKQAAGKAPMLVLMSGLDKLREEDMRSIGINIFLKKPFEAREILATVQRILGIEQEPLPKPDIPAAQPERQRSSVSLPPLPKQNISPELPPIPAASESQHQPPIGSDWEVANIAPDSRGRMPLGTDEKIPEVFADFDPIYDGDEAAQRLARIPLQESPKKGRKAFADADTPRPMDQQQNEERVTSRPEVRGKPPGNDSYSVSPDFDAGPIMPLNIGMTSAEIAHVIKSAITDYCAKHFDQIAREIITSELRRLADEKSRHLLDT
jgi:two-component system chemotaxis response regulator CheY